MRYPILALIRSEIDQGVLNCCSPLRDFEVKFGRFQIKQNVLNFIILKDVIDNYLPPEC